ncbi:hypothetical protein HID58_053329, partial [Brassica napus]
NHQGGARWTNYRSNDLRNARSDDPRNARSEARENSYRYGSAKSSGFEENRRRYDERLIHNLGSSSLSRRPLPALASHDQAATGQTAQHRDQSIPEVTRQQNSPSKEASSQSMHSPQRTISGSQRRGILASRLSDPRTDHGTSEERKSAKEHLSVHISRTSNAKQGESNTSGRLHDVEVQYLEEVKTPQVQPAAITRPSSLNVFDSGRLGSFERSPIRTLSEDRLHVSLRHGPLEGENLPDLPILSKAEGKKKMVKPQGRKRVARSPPQGVNVKKRRITKPPTPPHRKLLMDAINLNSNIAIKQAQAELEAALSSQELYHIAIAKFTT